MSEVWDILLNVFMWAGLLLGLLIVTIFWVIIIYVVADEIIAVYKEFRKPKDDEDYNIYGEQE